MHCGKGSEIYSALLAFGDNAAHGLTRGRGDGNQNFINIMLTRKLRYILSCSQHRCSVDFLPQLSRVIIDVSYQVIAKGRMLIYISSDQLSSIPGTDYQKSFSPFLIQ